MRARHWFGSSLFVLGLAINPAYFAGCGGGDDGDALRYDFGEAEMVEMLASLNETAAWSFESEGVSYTAELALTRDAAVQALHDARGAASPFARSARACGTTTRMFAASASACVTSYISSLPVRGTLSLVRNEADKAVQIESLPVTGRVAVDGVQLARAWLTLELFAGERAAFQLTGTHQDGFQFQGFVGMDLGADRLDIEEGSIEPSH